MKFKFSENEFIEIEIVEKTTLGTSYDCALLVSLESREYKGSVETWVDGSDMEAYLFHLKEMDKKLNISVQLCSSSPNELFLEIKPVDSLGHFILLIEIGRREYIYNQSCEIGVKYAFPLDSQRVSEWCNSQIQYLEEVFGK